MLKIVSNQSHEVFGQSKLIYRSPYRIVSQLSRAYFRQQPKIQAYLLAVAYKMDRERKDRLFQGSQQHIHFRRLILSGNISFACTQTYSYFPNGQFQIDSLLKLFSSKDVRSMVVICAQVNELGSKDRMNFLHMEQLIKNKSCSFWKCLVIQH